MNQKQNKALRLIESVFITFNTLKYVQGSFWNLSYFQVDAWVYNSFMAGRACGQYEANPVYWLANWALSCLLGLSALISHKGKIYEVDLQSS